MQTRHVPSVTPKYWVALILASIVGANTGDYFADGLGLGHIAGLPFLAVVFALLLVGEAVDKRAHYGWYWLAIILVRTAATNLGDIFHDFRISFFISIPCFFIFLFGLLLLWKKVDATSASAFSATTKITLPTNSFYWLSMLTVGTWVHLLAIGFPIRWDWEIFTPVSRWALGWPLCFLQGERA